MMVVQVEQFKVLVFSKIVGWYYDVIFVGVVVIQWLGQFYDFGVFWIEDVNCVMNDQELVKYQVVVFLFIIGDILDVGQKVVFECYICVGGGFVGVYSVVDIEYGWFWYM